ncbi:MAG: CpsB/CapC family capsule biosynthesis tyrosine phosphatase [Planctomycetota bacterium]
MEITDSFVDIHCHLLPGLDDGPATWSESVLMAEMAVADGVSTIVATPHQLGSYPANRVATIYPKVARLQELLDGRKIPLQVLPGAEVRIEPDLVGRIRSGDVLTVADRRRHLLLELPQEVYFPLDRPLAELHAAGIVGILAHPERNLGILASPGVLRPLVEAGCLLQVTAASLLGVFGGRIRTFTEQLIKQRLVSLVSSDAHGTKSRPPGLRAAFDRVAELAGHSTAVALCCRNPACVVAGQPLSPIVEMRPGLLQRFLRKIAG